MIRGAFILIVGFVFGLIVGVAGGGIVGFFGGAIFREALENEVESKVDYSGMAQKPEAEPGIEPQPGA